MNAVNCIIVRETGFDGSNWDVGFMDRLSLLRPFGRIWNWAAAMPFQNERRGISRAASDGRGASVLPSVKFSG
jgi:hypothetical protein